MFSLLNVYTLFLLYLIKPFQIADSLSASANVLYSIKVVRSIVLIVTLLPVKVTSFTPFQNAIYSSSPYVYDTNATFLLSGLHDGTLKVPCPP